MQREDNTLDTPIISPRHSNDHDLLITLLAKTENLIQVMREVKDCLEKKADASKVRELEGKVEGQEKRIQGIEKRMWMAMGALTILELIFKVIEHPVAVAVAPAIVK